MDSKLSIIEKAIMDNKYWRFYWFVQESDEQICCEGCRGLQ